MRIALVGPTHPYKGGVAAHTTQTAHELAAAGHDVELVSWSRLYPEALYPGDQAVPSGGPDLPPYPRTTRPLRWDRPGTWWRTGRSLRRADLVVIVVVVPAQVPALRTLAAAVRRSGSAGPGGTRPRIVVLAHNVVPHETHPGGRFLINRMIRAADAVLVHSAEQAGLARAHGAREVLVADLPPHLPGGWPDAPPARRPRAPGEPVRVLALGIVRRYKGTDLLLEAARDVPEVAVTVAGEQWGEAGARVRALAGDPRLAGRVRIVAGYVPGDRVPGLLREHDVLALPYRTGTASQNVVLGHAYGMPLVASRVGTFGAQVRDGVDGLLVPPGDPQALAGALRRLTEPGVLDALRAGVPAVDARAPWRDYVAALTQGSPRRVGSPS
jgi:glycosyltransferase involved in cell wall biosynthesis